MSYIPHVSRDPTVIKQGALTNSFASSAPLRSQNWNQLILYLLPTLSTATDIRVQIEVACPTGDDLPTTWYKLMWQDGGSAATAANITTVPGTIYEIKLTSDPLALPLPLNYKWVRILAKATGTVGSCALTITATTGLA